MKSFSFVSLAMLMVLGPLAGCHPREGARHPDEIAVVPPSVDCFTTPQGETGGSLASRPLPADFFAPGSEPFGGHICFQGNPNNPLDTCVKRSNALSFDRYGKASTRIELIELDLVSCKPIVVKINGRDTTWDVSGTISRARPSAGRMEVTRTSNRGGTFVAELEMSSRLTFRPRDPGFEVRVFDMGEMQVPPETLSTAQPVPWQYSTSLPLLYKEDCGHRVDNHFVAGVSTTAGLEKAVTMEHRGEVWGHFPIVAQLPNKSPL